MTNVWIYSEGKTTPLLASPFNEDSAKFSADGRSSRLTQELDQHFGTFDTRDGRRFLTVTPRTVEPPLELGVVLNWFEELERLAPHQR